MANLEEVLKELQTIGNESGTGTSSQQIQGTNAAGATATGYPLQVGVVYNPSGTSLSNGTIWPLQADSSGNLKTTLSTLIAGEDLTNDVQKVEQRFSSAYLTLASLTVVKSAAGFVHSINFEHSSNPTLTVYDNTAGSGAVRHIFGAGVAAQSYVLDETYATGLSFVFQPGNAPAVSVTYR